MTNFLVLKGVPLTAPRSRADDAVNDLHVVANRYVVEHNRILNRNIGANLAVATDATVLNGRCEIGQYAILVQHTVDYCFSEDLLELSFGDLHFRTSLRLPLIVTMHKVTYLWRFKFSAFH